MEEFKKEVSQMLTSDIMLILEDQLDLYSDEEIEILRKELSNRSCSNTDLKKEIEVVNKRLEIEQEKKLAEEKRAAIEAQTKDKEKKIKSLHSLGYNEYYEYTALTICDNSKGYTDVDLMVEKMNELALNGWRLVTAFTNELGKNSFSGGFGGISSGTNSTIEQNILLFERRVKIKGAE